MDYRCLNRVVLPCEDLGFYSELERMEDTVWLSCTCRCDRYTLIGVPGNLIDVLIETDLMFPAVLEIGVKAGKYDGKERTRLTFRTIHPGMRYSDGALLWERCRTFDFRLLSEGALIWEASYRQLRWQADGPEVVLQSTLWHANHYYRHLFPEHEQDVHQAARLLSLEQPELWIRPLASINRAVSRMLYRLSVDLGWRKLTRREGGRYLLDSYGWIRRDSLTLAAMEAAGQD